ncbi:MAG: flippase-like domain-containing protein [Deltaproteobacteria bacterium]|nr:flippase-like domain-containing protein [Deltaproteobacteria bacterium]
MPRGRTAGERGPAWLRWVTRASIVVGLIALSITVWAVGTEPLLEHLRAIGPWFVVLIAIEGTATFCEAGSTYLMTRGPGGPAWRKVCVAQFAGRAVNSVTPGANLGEALKVSLLARECSTQRVVAGVMFTALASGIVAMTIVAAGSLITAIAFPIARSASIVLLIAGAVATVMAGGLAILVRRGMLGSLARTAGRLHVLSAARVARWSARLDDVDARLRGEIRGEHRLAAACLVVVSQLLQRGAVLVTIFATGYTLGVPQLIAILSAGVLLAWISNVVPLGIGVAEGGNFALFAALGAPPSLGVALALAKRVNQIVFAALGFGVLAADRIAERVDRVRVLPELATTTSRHAVML